MFFTNNSKVFYFGKLLQAFLPDRTEVERDEVSVPIVG